MQTLEPYIDYVTIRSLPVTVKFSIDDREMVERALHELSEHGVVVIHEAATDTLYEIGPEQHLAAAYYRNSIIHFFVNGAVAELALLADTEAGRYDVVVCMELLEHVPRPASVVAACLECPWRWPSSSG